MNMNKFRLKKGKYIKEPEIVPCSYRIVIPFNKNGDPDWIDMIFQDKDGVVDDLLMDLIRIGLIIDSYYGDFPEIYIPEKIKETKGLYEIYQKYFERNMSGARIKRDDINIMNIYYRDCERKKYAVSIEEITKERE